MNKKPTMKSKKGLKVRVGLTLMSLAVSLTAFGYVTYSWFMFNRRADIGGTDVDVDGNFDVTYSLYEDGVLKPNGDFEFSDFYPGAVHHRTLSIHASNFGEDVNMAWSFKPPTALQEVPFIDTNGDYGTAGDYYYLGSQIQIESVNVKVNNIIKSSVNAAGTYLVTTNSVGLTKGQVNGVSTPPNMTKSINIVEEVIVPFNQTAIIDVVFTFVDNGTNQNVYKDAWPTVGVSNRLLGLFLVNL